MDTQGYGAVILPEKIQEAINIAEAKVAVLRDEEIRLGRVKGEMEKEVARLEIRRDTLASAIPELEASVINLQGNVDSLAIAVEKSKSDLLTLEDSAKSVTKEIVLAQEATQAESLKLSETVLKAREVEEASARLKESLSSDIAAFEIRKARVQELLASI